MVSPESPKARTLSWNLDLLGRILSALGLAAFLIYCVVGAVSVNRNSIKLLSNPLDNTLPEGANAYTAIRAGATGQLYIS